MVRKSISTVFPGRPDKGAEDGGLSAAHTIALKIDGRDRITDRSPASARLAGFWEAGYPALKGLVAGARRAPGVPVESRLSMPDGAGLWAVAVTLPDATLLVANDTTLSDTVTGALIDSRELLKALLDEAVDLAFEVDGEGRFRFLTPASVWGFETEAWLGKDATQLFWASGTSPARNPFFSDVRTRFEQMAVWPDGVGRRWVDISVQPLHGEDGGARTGVRGTVHDVTEQVVRARETRLTNLRLSIQERLTHILTAVDSADDLLEKAAGAVRDLLRADTVSVLTVSDGRLMPAYLDGGEDGAVDIGALTRVFEKSPVGDAVPPPFGHDTPHGEQLIMPLVKEERLEGLVIIGRDTSVSPWSDQEKALVTAIGSLLMAALEKARLIDRLTKLSARDELTGLLNRRAFTDAVERRLKHQRRTGQAGVLIFIDLDHFKEVNDTLGHAAGDKALRLVATRISSMIRSSDYAGRIGGDEFVVWLEDMSEENAATKAQSLLDAMPAIRGDLGAPDLKLSASIGICRSMPGQDMVFETLSDRADAALYSVKREGRNGIAFAGSGT